MIRHKQDLLFAVGVVLVAALVVTHFYPRSGPSTARISPERVSAGNATPESSPGRLAAVPSPVIYDSGLDNELWSQTTIDIRNISAELSELLRRHEFRVVADELLTMAAAAVDEHDEERLGGVLSLLGQLSIEEQDFDAAELYLQEALEVYENNGDSMGAAQAHLHLGRMHLKLRQRARTAGQAYDRLLIARWQLHRGHLDSAEPNLRLAIDENLSINRFGAAASAYVSLRSLYEQAGDAHRAEQAAVEAARLYAASGQLDLALSAVDTLERSGVSPDYLLDVEDEIARRHEEFMANVLQVQRAQDYSRLYHHYRSRGLVESAWRLRLQASASLRNVSKREMYHRIPDVLALLYVSNDNRERANVHLERASEAFDMEGREDLLTRARDLQAGIL